jgi:hypothetical protein
LHGAVSTEHTNKGAEGSMWWMWPAVGRGVDSAAGRHLFMVRARRCTGLRLFPFPRLDYLTINPVYLVPHCPASTVCHLTGRRDPHTHTLCK